MHRTTEKMDHRKSSGTIKKEIEKELKRRGEEVEFTRRLD